MTTRITALEAYDRSHDGGEVAFLDVREDGQFGEGHPLFAVPCPYSRLEMRIGSLVPRRSVSIILIDDDDGVAVKAARRLATCGYTDVATVTGGVSAWAAAGLNLFKGVNVPSKVLGELAEKAWHPPIITSETLAAWQRERKPYLLFDARPPSEYAKMCVPTAFCLPNGELAHRLEAAVPDVSTPIVVTCAGRTRGLIGVAGLRLAGIDNPVFALENGTQGWALAGFELKRGNTAAPYPSPTDEALSRSRARAERFAARHGIGRITTGDLMRLRAESERTTYVFDVRSAEEAREDAIAIAQHAPSGQLVQATDQWIGVRHARLVLCDDGGLRACLAAFWLRQLGFDTRILPIDDDLRALPTVSEPLAPMPIVEAIAHDAAWRGVQNGKVRMLDLRSSAQHRHGHPKGAAWTIRPRLERTLSGFRGSIAVVVDDPMIARLAAIDLRELGCAAVLSLQGDVEAWASAGLPLDVGPSRFSDEEALDILLFVHDRHDGNLDASRRYLAWETALVAQLASRERAEFKLPAIDA